MARSQKGHTVRAEFPEKLRFLFEPRRYKVAYGGRGSGKSWAFARALLIQGAARPVRILCTREVQKSIKESVHSLLADQIQALELGALYSVLETEIRGRNGTRIVFAGLASHTVQSIKSYEGMDVVWVEEAQTVSKKSWDILTPTIRRPGSEIWVSFNPELDSDETYQRFIVSPPPDCTSMEVNWSDNPWFPQVLDAERQHCQITAPDDYPTIWEGKCRTAVVGAIYAREMDQLIRDERLTRVPYDPRLKVHAVWDLGWNDSTAIILVQRQRSELRVIDFIEDSHRTLDSYAAELRDRRLNWGHDWLPHDAWTGDLKTGKTVSDLLKRMGRSPRPAPRATVEAGIRQARMALPQTVFDLKARPLIEHLKRYRRRIDAATNEPGEPLHDEHSHGADAYRYLALVADQLDNELDTGLSPLARPAYDNVVGL